MKIHLFAQCVMGAYILGKANKIIRIPESASSRMILYGGLSLMLPFVPCILLLQVFQNTYVNVKVSTHTVR